MFQRVLPFHPAPSGWPRLPAAPVPRGLCPTTVSSEGRAPNPRRRQHPGDAACPEHCLSRLRSRPVPSASATGRGPGLARRANDPLAPGLVRRSPETADAPRHLVPDGLDSAAFHWSRRPRNRPAQGAPPGRGAQQFEALECRRAPIHQKRPVIAQYPHRTAPIPCPNSTPAAIIQPPRLRGCPVPAMH